MRKGYIQDINSAAEFQHIIEQMNLAGVTVENISINKPINEVIASLESGDSLVVSSLIIFRNFTLLIDTAIDLINRDIEIESLSEHWFTITRENIELLKGVSDLIHQLRVSNIIEGLTRAKANGKKTGRPVGSTKYATTVKTAMKLRQTSKLSVAKACEIAGCQPRTYYRYLEKIK